MPTLDEINGVAVRTPIRMNLDAYAQALNKIDQRDLQARQVKSQIEAGLSDLYAKLNEADYPYLQNYIDSINQKISDAASYGNYANALNTAVSLAGSVLNNPELNARIKANQDYQTEVKRVRSLADNGRISTTTADRWIEENPYKFDEQKNRLVDYRSPVHDVNMDNAFNYLNAITLATTTQKPVYEYLDVNGKTTDAFNSAITKYNVQKTTIRTGDQLYNNFAAYLANHKDIYASLKQDFDDIEWEITKLEEKYETANPEEQKLIRAEINARKSMTRDPNNPDNKLDIVQYLKKRSDSFIKNLRINDVIESEKVSTQTQSNTELNAGAQEVIDNAKPQQGGSTPGVTQQKVYGGIFGTRGTFKEAIKSFFPNAGNNENSTYTGSFGNIGNFHIVPGLSNQ